MASHCVVVFSLVGLVVAPAAYAASVNLSSGSSMRANVNAQGLRAKAGSGMRTNTTGQGGRPASLNYSRGSAMRANVAGGGRDPSSVMASSDSAMRANAAGQNMRANVGSGMRANVAGYGGGVKVGMASGMNAAIAAGYVGQEQQPAEDQDSDARRGFASGVAKLFKMTGGRFFQMLSKIVPATVKLHKIIRSPAQSNPSAINKILDDLNVQLNKMVEKKMMDKEKADLLKKQTIKELKSALKGKIDVSAIKTI